MAIPVGGVRRPVTITNCAGDEVSITGGKLDVNATVVVPGDVPEMFLAQVADLSAAALNATDAIAKIKLANFLAIHLSAGLTAQQTLTITFVSSDGVAYNTVILAEPLPAGTADKYFAFPPQTLLRVGDHIKTQLTNAGESAKVLSMTLGFGT